MVKGKGKNKGSWGGKGKPGDLSHLDPNLADDVGEKVSETLMVGVDKIGLLIGRGGAKVKDLNRATGAEVVICNTDWSDKSGGITTVKVVGTKKQVEAAMDILNATLAWAAAHPRDAAGELLPFCTANFIFMSPSRIMFL